MASWVPSIVDMSPLRCRGRPWRSHAEKLASMHHPFLDAAHTWPSKSERCWRKSGVYRRMADPASEVQPQVVLVIRGFAHVARIATQRPQQFDPMFNAVHTHLFNNGLSEQKHAVIPDIQYSDKLKDLLESAQQLYLRIPAERNPLRVVLRHMSYAKHRFDSMADPVAKTAVMLLPICTLLYHQLRQPRRQGKTRACCIGIAPVYAEMLFVAWCSCRLWSDHFVRIFDCLQHDIAASELAADLTAKAGLTAHAETIARARQLKGTFVTELVRRQTKKSAVFSAGPQQLLIWGANTTEEVREVAGRCAYMTEVMLERLRAESESDQLRSALASCQSGLTARMTQARRPMTMKRALSTTHCRSTSSDNVSASLRMPQMQAASICKEAGLTAKAGHPGPCHINAAL